MALEPITRQEKIIAGQDLTPITRMEKFLKNFGGGGGGLPSGGTPYQQLVTDGDGNARWEDRLAYVATEEQVFFLQEDMEFTDASALIVSPFGELIIGNKYTVIWDGVTHENLTAFDDDGYVAIGSPLDSISDDLPFNISTDYDEDGEVIHLEFVALTSDNTHSVTIFGAAETVHKIPLVYLPEKTNVYVYLDGTYMYFDSKKTRRLSAEDFISAVNSGGIDFIKLPISSEEAHLQMIGYRIIEPSGTVIADIAQVVDSTINILSCTAEPAGAPS